MCSLTDAIVQLVLLEHSAQSHLKLRESWFCSRKPSKKLCVKPENSSARKPGGLSTVSAQASKALSRKAFAPRGCAIPVTGALPKHRCRTRLLAQLSTSLGLSAGWTVNPERQLGRHVLPGSLPSSDFADSIRRFIDGLVCAFRKRRQTISCLIISLGRQFKLPVHLRRE